MAVRKLFLSVGAMKAGTTFLFNVFSRHPELYFTPEKELHFFAQTGGLSADLRTPLVTSALGNLKARVFGPGDILSPEFRRHRLSMVMHNRFAKLQDADRLREIVRWYADRYLTNPIDDAWFDRVFEAAGDRYASDFSNYHALLGRDGWKHVKSLADEVKVIYTLRHPVSRLWSHVKFHYIQSGRRAALDSFDLAEMQDILREGAISCHARYGDIVESLMENLQDDQLKVIVFEDFMDDFIAGARQVETFLGIGEHHYRGVNPDRKANATEEIAIAEPIRALIVEAVTPQLEKLRRLGIDLPQSYWK